MGKFYKVTKGINGRLYDYWQRTRRVGKSVKTENKYNHNEVLTAILRFENLPLAFPALSLRRPLLATDYGAAFSTREGASMKVLFLDIDGVLNCFGDEDGNGATTECFGGLLGLDAGLLRIYKAMLSRIDVTVVLSSSWRFSRELLEYLTQHDVYFHDVTPAMDPEAELSRGLEIQLWLNEYPDEVERYAILDDQEEEMLEEHAPNFFHVSCDTGITQELADRIVAHLTDWSIIQGLEY